MTVITQNGWQQCTREECETLAVVGTDDDAVRIELRKGDVATILTAWAAWFHRNVRPINSAPYRDCWGWSRTNKVWNSNHLSGTAVDLCASELPWNRLTMPAGQVQMVEHGLRVFEGTVFWGRWLERPDEMHFEILGSPIRSEIHRLAERLRAGYLDLNASFAESSPAATTIP
jgi:hypothetical protein